MALTTDQFRDQVIASGLLTAEDLSSILTALPAEKAPRDGEQLARELVRQKRLTRFQAEQIYLGKGKSLVLGNYTILEKLGQGGMGMVLKAEHKRLKRLVALKVLSPAALKTPDALKRFHREVEAAAKLRHTNVVATDDADEAKGTHFLVMEYVEGSDLSALVKKKGPLSVGQAVQCILQAARGLEYAHEQGVVHRDIKPANLLLDTKGTVKILDMGLARIEGDSAGRAELTSTGAVMGTVDYMAPEQALSTKSADARSDIYSLGISLWYLLTGKCVFDGDTLMAKLLAHRDAPIPSLCAARSEVSASIDAVFQKMVAKQAKDRYQSMTEVIRDLEACQGGASSTSSLSVSTVDDDANPFSFLNTPDGATVTVVKTRQALPTAKHAAADAAAEATMLTGDLDQITDPQAMTSVRAGQKRKQRSSTRPSSSPPWWQNRRVQMGGGAAAVLLLLAVVFLFQTPSGTLRVEILDPQVEMKVKGTELTFQGSDLEPVSLKAGEKTLLVTRGDLSFETEGFTLKKGTETRVKVELLGDKLVVNGGGKVIAEQSIKRKEIATPTTGIDSVASKSRTPNGPVPPPAIAPFDAAQAKAHQGAWAKHLGVPVEFTNTLGMKFKLIPPGEFMMGCDPKEAEAIAPRIEDERLRQVFLAVTSTAAPRHVVRITQPYYLQTHEVTNGAYQQVMGKLPEKNDPAKPDWPVMSNVGLADATAFCDALSQKEGKASAYRSANGNLARIREANGYRLPTEAEWEYACRAGTTTLWFMGDDGKTASDCDRLKEFQTYIVGAGAKPNPFGLFDLYGGSTEWCFDSFAPYEPEAATDPFTEPNGSEAVARGGSFFSGGGASIVDVNSVARQRGLPNNVGNDYTGLGRVLLPIEMPDASGTPRPGVPPASSGKLFLHDPAFLKWLKDVQAMSAEKQIEAVSKKLVELNPGFDGKLGSGWNGQILRGPKVENGVVMELMLFTDKVTDISPLRVLSGLKTLTCMGSDFNGILTDISPLQGMQLTTLSLQGNRNLTDTSPLKGMPLTHLQLFLTGVTNLTHLNGMPLKLLGLRETAVVDLSPLKDMKLNHLDMLGCRELTDLSPLKDMQLEILTISETKVSELSLLAGMPLKVIELVFRSERDTELLRSIKTLERINGKPAAEFWKEVDEQQKGKPGITPDGPVPPPAKAPFDARQARAHQEAWAKHLGVPVEYTNSIGMKFVLIPPGEFTMGSTPAEIEEALEFTGDNKHWQECIKSEAPQHKVILAQSIYLGVNEVTQAEYEKVIGSNPSEFAPLGKSKEAVAGMETASHPVEQASWNDAAEFCAKLSEQEKLKPCYFRAGDTTTMLKEGTGYRLPTEAEWEFACRAGTTTKYWIGDNDEDLPPAGWINVNSASRTHEVGALKANPLGLYDIHGNAWEWVQDWWEPTHYGQFREKPALGPSGPSSGTLRVIRGGVWYGPASFCRSSHRDADAASNRGAGFRVSLTLDAVKAAVTTGRTPAASAGKLFLHDPAFLQWVKDVQAMPAEKQLEAVSKKMIELNPGFDGNLSHVFPHIPGSSPVIEQGQVVEVGFSSSVVTNIAPLRAFGKLRALSCAGSSDPAQQPSSLIDITPLRGMEIERLAVCWNQNLSDISPVVWPGLRELTADDSKVVDLAPLRGTPLRKLRVDYGGVRDLSPLEGMPLEELGVAGDGGGTLGVTDLSPLKGMPLRVLSIAQNTSLADISPLAGMPLDWLVASGTNIESLEPLRGMKIRQLALIRTRVTDLSPLKGMPLETLELMSTPISDLTPLQGAPLASLQLLGCDRLRDCSPLKDMSLKDVFLDFNAKRDTQWLRSLRQLERINGKPVAEFWKEVEQQQ